MGAIATSGTQPRNPTGHQKITTTEIDVADPKPHLKNRYQ